MADNNEIKLFSKTFDAIRVRLDNLQEKLRRNSLALSSLDSDGDVMDDNNFRSLRTERELLEGEIQELKWLLGADAIQQEELALGEEVSLGHTVVLVLRYPDGERDQFAVTVVGTIDSKYLPSIISNRENHRLLSIESPLAKALLGRTKGDKVRYGAPDGEVEVEILSFVENNFLINQES